jgi:hypothetical protein
MDVNERVAEHVRRLARLRLDSKYDGQYCVMYGDGVMASFDTEKAARDEDAQWTARHLLTFVSKFAGARA